MSRESRLDVRTHAHLQQCFHYQRLICILKPEWFRDSKEGLAFADTEECPLNDIHDIFHLADVAWENKDDYHKAIDEASEKCSKAINEFERKYRGRHE